MSVILTKYYLTMNTCVQTATSETTLTKPLAAVAVAAPTAILAERPMGACATPNLLHLHMSAADLQLQNTTEPMATEVKDRLRAVLHL